MSLILIRHGETALNAARILQWPDTPLGERGFAQAQALAQHLARRQPAPARLVTSDMTRARQTAAAIAAATGLPVIETELLRERHFGDLRGQPYDALGHDPITDERAPPGGESLADVRARATAAFAWLLAQRREAGGDLLVVSHGLFLRLLIAGHAGLAPGQEAPHRLSNTSVSVLAAEPPHALLSLDDTAHLSGTLHDDGRGVAGV